MKPVQTPARKAAVMTGVALMAKSAPVTESHSLSANDAFEQGMAAIGTRRDEATGGIALYDRSLIEDDGPGVGYYQPGKNAGAPWLKLGGTGSKSQRVKKILHIDRPQASAAHLFLRGNCHVEINGKALDLPEREYEDSFHPVPLSMLKKGDNEIIISAADGITIKTAARKDILRNAPDRQDRPPRSFTSDDDGKTWHPFDGEFSVRLHLVQHTNEGSFISPVLDLAQSQDNGQAFGASAKIHSARLTADAKTPAGTSIHFLARSGSTPVFDSATWSDWKPISEEKEIARPARYLQWKAILKTTTPTATPILKNVTVDAKIVREEPPAWANERITVTACQNPIIKYTSIPYAYEDPLHPRMVALRKKYKLDEVVAPAKREFEKFLHLRNWVSNQWKWTPPIVDYPDWDADEILTRKYGFCVQHAITYMQCAISLGYQTRFAFSNNPGNGGHEVCEVWSNEYQKWVYMDSADNFHYVDRKTNIPLSLLETHDLIFKTYLEGKPLAYSTLSNEKKLVPELGICYGTETEPTGKSPEWSREQAVNGVYPLSRMWTLLRYMPRNNFYTQPYPAPICQGRHWDWSEYIVWEGPQMPKGQWLYKNFTARRSDLDWTINQVRFDATCDAKPGAINLQLATVTPNFETFLTRIDNGPWQPQPKNAFTWRLHPRANRLEMRIRTTAAIEGPISLLELNYQP